LKEKEEGEDEGEVGRDPFGIARITYGTCTGSEMKGVDSL
jgi:hypothetical protein